MCKKKKCKCKHKHKRKQATPRHQVAPNPFNPRRAVIEKPKRLKKEPIDEVVFDPERQMKHPPKGFVDLILEPSDALVRLKWKRRRR